MLQAARGSNSRVARWQSSSDDASNNSGMTMSVRSQLSNALGRAISRYTGEEPA